MKLSNTQLANIVVDELAAAEKKFGPMASAHEGYAVLLEEVDELWEEVRKKQSTHDRAAMYKEAVQIAAMAMRFIKDVCMKSESN